MTDTVLPAPRIRSTDMINAIIARYPQALPVLARFGFDTCCGGMLPVATAVAHHGLDLSAVLRAIEDAVGDGRDE